MYDVYRLTGPSLAVFDREHSERVVDVIPWVVSTRLARLLLEDVAVPILFSVIYYFMCGFDVEAGQFFRFFVVVLFNQFISVSLAMLCSAISRDFAIATLIANLVSVRASEVEKDLLIVCIGSQSSHSLVDFSSKLRASRFMSGG